MKLMRIFARAPVVLTVTVSIGCATVMNRRTKPATSIPIPRGRRSPPAVRR